MRPENYRYLDIFTNHLNKDAKKVFNGEIIYPRQMEVHLPADRKTACNFHCYYCQGAQVQHLLGNWEQAGLKVVEQLQGKIPYYVFGGVYTEPLMNEYIGEYILMAKRFNNSFGIHTNGSYLLEKQDKEKFCEMLINKASSPLDYISVSLDGGDVESHMKVKNVKEDHFTRIIEGLKLLVKLRGDKKYPAIRVCYLMTKFSSDPGTIANIVRIMKEIKVDSLRFSVPYDHYGKKFDTVRAYRNKFEIPFGEQCAEIVKPFCSSSFAEKPYIFWHPPGFQDVEKMNFKQCVYSYYQITFAADGYVYKCSSTAAPEFTHARLGTVPDNLEDFNRMVLENHKASFHASTCFNVGARCNRIALEINQSWNNGELFANQNGERSETAESVLTQSPAVE